MINDHKLVKEVFSDSAFTGRMHNPSFDMFTTNDVHGTVIFETLLRYVILRMTMDQRKIYLIHLRKVHNFQRAKSELLKWSSAPISYVAQFS